MYSMQKMEDLKEHRWTKDKEIAERRFAGWPEQRELEMSVRRIHYRLRPGCLV